MSGSLHYLNCFSQETKVLSKEASKREGCTYIGRKQVQLAESLNTLCDKLELEELSELITMTHYPSFSRECLKLIYDKRKGTV
jgi:hypothetical protein